MATTRTQTEAPDDQSAAESVIREVLAGDKRAAVRRIALYVTVFASMGASYYAPALIVPGIVAGVLLLATDVLL